MGSYSSRAMQGMPAANAPGTRRLPVPQSAQAHSTCFYFQLSFVNLSHTRVHSDATQDTPTYVVLLSLPDTKILW